MKREGDVNAQADAQSILARASLDAERAKIQKEQLEAQAAKFKELKEETAPPVVEQQAPPPPRSKSTSVGGKKTNGLVKMRQ